MKARASFSGSWHGQGTASGSHGFSAQCSLVSSRITQTAKELVLSSGGWQCGDLKTQRTPARIEIRGGSLWLHGKAVGKIDSKKISAEIPNGNLRASYAAELVDDNTMTYEERVTDGEHLLVLKGKLKKN